MYHWLWDYIKFESWQRMYEYNRMVIVQYLNKYILNIVSTKQCLILLTDAKIHFDTNCA